LSSSLVNDVPFRYAFFLEISVALHLGIFTLPREIELSTFKTQRKIWETFS